MRKPKKIGIVIFLNRLFRFLAIATLSVVVVLAGCQFNTANSLDKEVISLERNGKASTSSSESLLADLGFRPVTNGFSFENYGKDDSIKNLSSIEMQRMFGNKVCATTGNTCILKPPAQQWMEEVNKSMNGGHCEGMAALSLILYADQDKSRGFGNTPDLQLKGNEKLQREIAYWFSTQYAVPTAPSEIKDKPPSELLDLLLSSLQPNAPIEQTYTMGIYQAGFRGGHAITPYAVEDLGNGKYAVMVYDNNHPKVERKVEIDRKANTWKYNAATNPDEPESQYMGDAETKTLTLTPTPPRYQRQVCSFCDEEDKFSENSSDQSDRTVADKGKAIASEQFNQIFLEGDADLLITNGTQKIGYENGKFVNNFSGATFTPIRSSELWKDDDEPLYNIPSGVPFKIILQGDKPSNDQELTDIAMIGSDYDLGISSIKTLAGQKDLIDFEPNGRSLAYKPSYAESPDIFFGISTQEDDYEFELYGIEVDAGGTIKANLEPDKGRLGLKISDSKREAKFGLMIGRIDDQKEQKFEADNLLLASGDTLYFDYAKWTGNGANLTIELDKGSDGTIDSTTTVEDKKK